MNKPKTAILIALALALPISLSLCVWAYGSGERKEKMSHAIIAIRVTGDYLADNATRSIPHEVKVEKDFYSGERDGIVSTIDPFDSDLLCSDCQVGEARTARAVFRIRGRLLKIVEVSSSRFALFSHGPDRDRDLPIHLEENQALENYGYDPTNGTYSSGDVFMVFERK